MEDANPDVSIERIDYESGRVYVRVKCPVDWIEIEDDWEGRWTKEGGI